MNDNPICQRVNKIEAALPAAPSEADTRWLVEQMRGWQQFGVRVVEFQGVLQNCPTVADAIREYETLFSVTHG